MNQIYFNSLIYKLYNFIKTSVVLSFFHFLFFLFLQRTSLTFSDVQKPTKTLASLPLPFKNISRLSHLIPLLRFIQSCKFQQKRSGEHSDFAHCAPRSA